LTAAGRRAGSGARPRPGGRSSSRHRGGTPCSSCEGSAAGPAARPVPACRRPALEALEGRSLPSGLSFQFQIDDPNGEFSAYPLLSKNLYAAGQILSSVLNGQGTVQVLVRANDAIPRSNGSTVGVATLGSVGGVTVIGSSALAVAQTGVNPNGTGPDIELDFNARDYLPHAWFDPSGAVRTGRVPAGRADFISVVLHEMVHGLGFQGYRAVGGPGYGTLPAGVESSFDARTSFVNGVLYFTGPLATAVNKGPVALTSVGPTDALTSQNFYHLGNPSGRPGANLSGDVMNGMMFGYGTRYALSTVDLAILADLGWSVPGFPPLPPPWASPPAGAAPAPPPANLPGHRRHAPRRVNHVQQAPAAAPDVPLRLRPARGPFVNPFAGFLLFI
jgi:hypothetical protein